MVPVSLGQTCQTRFQLLRWLYAKRFPHRSLDDFRRDLYARSPDAHVLPKYPFDWQITAPETVCEWLERDFQGVFELADLVSADGGVRNQRFPAVFPHHFHGADIAGGYNSARQKFEAHAERFRALRYQEPVFLMFAPTISAATKDRLSVALRRYTSGPVRLHFGPTGDVRAKDADFAWEGDDLHWASFLDHHTGVTEALPSETHQSAPAVAPSAIINL